MIPSLILSTAIVAAPLPASAAPQPPAQSEGAAIDPQRLAIGRELIAVVLPPAQREQMMTAILRSLIQNMVAGMESGTGLNGELANKPAKKAAFDRFIERQRELGTADLKAALPDLVEAYARAYARNFTLDELTQIKMFLVTPTGAKFMQRAPSLLADPDVSAMMRRMTQASSARMAAEMARFKAELTTAEGVDAAHGK